MTPEEERDLTRNQNIQKMLNDFLSEEYNITMDDILKKNEEREVIGVITATHKLMLQQMIIHKYPNINELISEKSETSSNKKQVLGVLTTVESELIEDLLAEYTFKQEQGKIIDLGDLVESPAKVA
jgi:hypothetical protein